MGRQQAGSLFCWSPARQRFEGWVSPAPGLTLRALMGHLDYPWAGLRWVISTLSCCL